MQYTEGGYREKQENKRQEGLLERKRMSFRRRDADRCKGLRVSSQGGLSNQEIKKGEGGSNSAVSPNAGHCEAVFKHNRIQEKQCTPANNQ